MADKIEDLKKRIVKLETLIKETLCCDCDGADYKDCGVAVILQCKSALKRKDK